MPQQHRPAARMRSVLRATEESPNPQLRTSSTAAWIDVLPPFLLTRLLFVLITLVTAHRATFLGLTNVPPIVDDGPVVGSWYRWDALWYMAVASDGYSRFPYQPGQIDTPFFPLYPALVHLLLHPWPWSRLAAPIALACLCALLAAYVLHRLVALDFGRAQARRAVWLFALLPTGPFLFAGYAESLFLLCCIQCFYRLRLDRWWQAGLWGGLAALTRPLGIILLVPYLVCWAGAHLPRARSHPRDPAPDGQPARASLAAPDAGQYHPRGPYASLRGVATGYRDRARGLLRGPMGIDLLGALLIPGGLALYMAYLWARFDDPLLFSSAQRAWHRGYTLPWLPLRTAADHLLVDLPHLTPATVRIEQDLLYTLAGLVLSTVALRHLPWHYLGYIWAFWLIALATSSTLDSWPAPLMGMPRYILTAFPLLIMLAATSRRTLITACIFLPLLVYETAIFVSGNFLA